MELLLSLEVALWIPLLRETEGTGFGLHASGASGWSLWETGRWIRYRQLVWSRTDGLMFLEGIVYKKHTLVSDHLVIFLTSHNINYIATFNYKWPVSRSGVIYTKMMVCFNESQMLLGLWKKDHYCCEIRDGHKFNWWQAVWWDVLVLMWKGNFLWRRINWFHISYWTVGNLESGICSSGFVLLLKCVAPGTSWNHPSVLLYFWCPFCVLPLSLMHLDDGNESITATVLRICERSSSRQSLLDLKATSTP